ncbi:MAG: Cys-tRNA(Pro) deacylase [Pseudomonadota bacterium]
MAVQKTNAARLLDVLAIEYTIHSVKVDESDLSAVSLAEAMGVPCEEVYKTLVVRGDKNGIFLACIMGADALNLKKAAKVTGNKSVAMVPMKEVLPLTGYIRGGCSPVGTKKPYPVYVDESAILHERIYVSAGQRGMDLHLRPDDLLQAVNGQYAELV